MRFVFNFLSSVHAERSGSNVDAVQVVGEGNASVTLTKLKIMDEGTYICTVSIGLFHAQQVIQLHIIRKFPPSSLNLEKSTEHLSCCPLVSLCFRTTSCFTL